LSLNFDSVTPDFSTRKLLRTGRRAGSGESHFQYLCIILPRMPEDHAPAWVRAGDAAWCGVRPPSAAVKFCVRIFRSTGRYRLPGEPLPNQSSHRDVVYADGAGRLIQTALVASLLCLLPPIRKMVESMFIDIAFHRFRQQILDRPLLRDPVA